jgi:aldehyde:ferredoxin oxidoreductase
MTLLRVNMSQRKMMVKEFTTSKIVGGRATIDYLMTEYGSPTAHPFSEESLFIVAPGLLAGTSAPMSGRLSMGGKSPLTGGIKEANVGGTAAHKLGRLSIQAIMVEGKAKEWQIMKIDSQGATLENAGDIVGLTNYAACDRLRERYGDKISIIIIGPAGEMKLANSTIAVTDLKGRPSRHAARGGVGTLMGSKGLKAIIIDDTEGVSRQAIDKDAFKAAVKASTVAIKNGPPTEALHNMGTFFWVDVSHSRGSLPTYNFHMGAFDKFQNINAEKLIELNKARNGSMGHGCMPGCVVRCSSDFHDPSGQYLTSALEYETVVLLGSNLGIDDLDAIARMDRKCDELGIDTIELGCTIGILNDVGLFDFGDSVKAEAFIEEIAKGTPLGRILGSGVETTAKVFGIDRVPAVKGQGLAGHAPRSLKGWGVTYATSPQGADHTAGSVLDDPLSPEGHVERSRAAQIAMAAFDATGLCLFAFLSRIPELIVPLINALYGVKWTEADYMGLGKEMILQERGFNLKAGIGPSADMIPDWMRKEPLPPNNTVFDVSQDDISDVLKF